MKPHLSSEKELIPEISHLTATHAYKSNKLIPTMTQSFPTQKQKQKAKIKSENKNGSDFSKKVLKLKNVKFGFNTTSLKSIHSNLGLPKPPLP